MKKCCFIVPYFGKFPKYFEIFLKSCNYNLNYDWLIFSDDKTKFVLPPNVKIVNISFSELKVLFQGKFDFEISLNTPYKLCDYKPAYGYIFEEYLKDYKFWGHCDLDIIVGNLDRFISNDMLNDFDKIFALGHMILYKNNYENNRVFMSEMNSELLYKQSFTTNNITVFDEVGVNNKNVNTIFIEKGKKVFEEDLSLNIKVLPTKFIRTVFDFNSFSFKDEKYINAIYFWKNGEVNRAYLCNREIIIEKFPYIHLQARKMTYNKKTLNRNYFKILPNVFLNMEYPEINVKNFKKIKKKRISLHYFILHYKWKKNRIKNKIIVER